MDEQTVWAGTPSHLVNLGHYVLYLLFFAALLTSAILLRQVISAHGTWVLAISGAMLLLPLLALLVKWLQLKSRRYELTNERLIISRGIFSKHMSVIELYRIKDYILEQPFFYRLFSLGNISVITSDAAPQHVTLQAVRGARRLLDVLRQNVEECRVKKGLREMDLEQEEDLPDP